MFDLLQEKFCDGRPDRLLFMCCKCNGAMLHSPLVLLLMRLYVETQVIHEVLIEAIAKEKAR
jgi:hypothetical protein